MSRKYRQRGYQDNSRKTGNRKGQTSRTSREGPRSPQMPGFRRVVKCALCGTKLSEFGEVTLTSQCPECSADLHSCKHCVHFNPTSRFECEQPISERISPKDKRADCEYFEIRSTVEKVTGSSGSGGSGNIDPRDAFENLFQK